MLKIVEKMFTDFLMQSSNLNIFLTNVRTLENGDINTIEKYIDLFEHRFSPDRKNYDGVYDLLINEAFNWGNTPQDYYFWQKVSMSWVNIWSDYCRSSRELPKTKFKSIW